AAVGHRKKGAHLELLDLIALEHFAFESELLRERLCPLGQMRGSADVAGKVAQIARKVHAVRYCKPAGRGSFAVAEIASLRDGKRQLAQGPAYFRGLTLHLVEPVDRFHGDYDRMLDAPRNLAPLDLFLG